jgi:hypothetical protein
MKRKPAFIFLALFLAGALPPLSARDQVGFGRQIHVGTDEVQQNIISFGGNVLVEGRIKDSIITFGGTVTLSGEVGDSVVGFGTFITLRSDAVVKGDVVSIGGRLEKEPGCSISGDTVYFKGGELFSKLFEGFEGSWMGFPFIPLVLILKAIAFFIWLFIALVVASLFPRQLATASSQIRTSFGPVVGIGALALILFVGLVIVFALLSLILIGIPFLLFLIAVGVVIKIFGEVVLFYFFGEAIGRSMRNKAPAPLAAVVLGLVVVSFIKLIPILGFIFSFFLGFIAWGAVLRTKFGTTENWFKRKA